MTDNLNKNSNVADVEEAIPMQKVKPLWLAIAGGGLLVVAGLVVFAMSGNKKDQAEVQKLKAKVGSQVTPEEAREQREELKEHLAITQKSLQKVAAEEKQEKASAEAKKQQEEQQKQEEEQKQAAAHAAPAVHHASGKAAKKMSHSLDNIGNDIASQLK